MARPAALPMAVAITPTIRAIIVDVIAPRIMSPFGSNAMAYPRIEYFAGSMSGKRHPAANDQMMMEMNGKKTQKTNIPRKRGLKMTFIIFYSRAELTSYRHRPEDR